MPGSYVGSLRRMLGRVCVIGAGHYGLVAAIRLSGRGHGVVVLEAAAYPAAPCARPS